MKYLSHSVTETAGIAGDVLRKISKGKNAHATVLALYGDLGSGKTTFVQELGKLSGIKDTMQSPTFVIIKSYTLQVTRYMQFFHLDLYRIERPEELLNLGWNDILQDQKNLVAIEWAERAEKFLPNNALRIHFKFIDERTREIDIEK